MNTRWLVSKVRYVASTLLDSVQVERPRSQEFLCEHSVQRLPSYEMLTRLVTQGTIYGSWVNSSRCTHLRLLKRGFLRVECCRCRRRMHADSCRDDGRCIVVEVTAHGLAQSWATRSPRLLSSARSAGCPPDVSVWRATTRPPPSTSFSPISIHPLSRRPHAVLTGGTAAAHVGDRSPSP